MTLHAKNAGAWRDIYDPSVKVAGTWQPVRQVWVKVSGVWQQAFQLARASISNQDLSVSDSPAVCYYKLNSNGQAQYEDPVNGPDWPISGEWLVDGANSDFEAYCTVNSGSLDGSSSPPGQWLALSATRRWGITQSSPGTSNANLTVQIRRVADLTVLDTATITLSAIY